jgi:hypothetical protein
MSEANVLGSEQRLHALLRWRQTLVRSGAVSPLAFKDAHVRLVHRSGCTDVSQIRLMLPEVVADHAEEMARILAEVDESVEHVQPHHGSEPRADEHDESFLEPKEFAPFAFGEQSDVIEPLSLRRANDDAVALSWSAYHAPFVAYRVVSGEEHAPYSPDRTQPVAITTETTAVDGRPATSAVRHYQVWVNAGASRGEALAAQPILHAAGVAVATVDDMVVREDSGRVVGQWKVFRGVRAVHVERVPVEEGSSGGPQYRILADNDNLAGFVDATAARGRRYLYRARCEVLVDNVARLSGAAQVEVAVSAVLSPVADLALTMHPTEPVTFDLSWTPPPAGQVAIFRTQDAPRADIGACELPEVALTQAGLKPELRLSHPVTERRDSEGHVRAVMADVPWPGDWSRAYFTPVTMMDAQVRVGKPTSSVRTATIHDIHLTEYCNKQVLTFTWPDGAAAVSVHVAPKGYDSDAGLTGRSYDITIEEYEMYGGMQFTGQLPVAGCSLHMAPVAFSAGRRVLGPVSSIVYDGLLRVWYSVHTLRDAANQPQTAVLEVRSEVDVTGSPPFVLVHNPDRIPLTVNDGQALDVAPLNVRGEITAQPSKEVRFSSLGTSGGGEVWAADVRGRTGWIRLLANLGDPKRLRRLALLDPPVSKLHLSGGPS